MPRGRPKGSINKKDFIEEIIEKLPKDELADMPLTSLEEHRAYNAKARSFNKKLGICRYKVKQCPLGLHPKDRVTVQNIQQPKNPVKGFLYNEDIDFDQMLQPGKEYDLPKILIDHMAGKGTDHWEWIENPDGSKQTKVTRKNLSYSIRTIATNV